MENTTQKKLKRRTKNIKKEHIFKKYSFEITIVSMISLGLFLLLENFELKFLIKQFFITFYEEIKEILKIIFGRFISKILKIESSDIFGISLLIFAFILLFLKWRHNLIIKNSVIDKCPKCSNKIHRIKRKKRIKILSYIIRLKVKHYHCHICKLRMYNIKGI